MEEETQVDGEKTEQDASIEKKKPSGDGTRKGNQRTRNTEVLQRISKYSYHTCLENELPLSGKVLN